MGTARRERGGAKFDMISGTNGLLGAADGGFLLSKENRTSNQALLEVAGRDQQDQKLRLTEWFPCGGSFPRDFQLAGNYLICANQLGNSVTVFDIADNNRKIASLEMKNPLCVCVPGER